MGSQKIVPDVETGLRRLRALVGQEPFVSPILILENEFMTGRSGVVLVQATAGF